MKDELKLRKLYTVSNDPPPHTHTHIFSYNTCVMENISFCLLKQSLPLLSGTRSSGHAQMNPSDVSALGRQPY